MFLFYTGGSPDNLRKAREHAPSHCHGFGWTPTKMTDHPVPWFLDNGAFTGDFAPREWLDALEAMKTDMPRFPEFVVVPDVYGDAAATVERHADVVTAAYQAHDPRRPGPDKRWAIVRRHDVDCYVVLQPGLPIAEQIDRHMAIAPPAGFFVGGSTKWKRAHGDEIVRRARELDKPVHVGRPGGADGLVWAYRTGFDSADTTGIFQNGYWHYLDELERVTEETHSTGSPRADEQAALAGWSR